MDDIVRQALAKWPHVPDCYGWLGLDARGDWYMRDDRAQQSGSFASGIAGSKGSLLRHQKLIEFIERNYEVDARGCWYFQNGPQRVFVELEITPFVWRIHPDMTVRTPAGEAQAVIGAWIDEYGYPYIETTSGVGVVHTQDVVHFADGLESGRWSPGPIQRAELGRKFRFVMSPSSLRPSVGTDTN